VRGRYQPRIDPRAAPPSRAALWLARALVLLVALFVYAGTFDHGFVYDDNVQIVANPWLASPAQWGKIFTHDIWGYARPDTHYYRPAMHVVFSLTRIAFGPGPGGFHAVVVLLHALTSVLVFELARALLLAAPAGAPRGPTMLLAAAAAGLVFAVHPIHSEAVAWASGLPDVGMALCYLASLLLYLRAQAPAARAMLLHAAGAVLFLGAALFKEPGATLPLLVVACDLAALPRGWPVLRWIVRYGSLGASLAVYLVLRANALGGFFGSISSSASGGVWALVEASGTALWRYLLMIVWPHPLNAYQTLATAPPLPALLAVILVAGALGTALWRRHLAGTCALGLFVAPLLPSFLVAVAIVSIGVPWAERYVYLPSAGAALAVALVVRVTEQRSERTRWAARAALLVLVLLGGVLTVRHTAVWHDDLALWTDTARRSPGVAVVADGLGGALLRAGRPDEAIPHLQQALALDPSRKEARQNLAIALMAKGRMAEAERELLEILRRDPRLPVTQAALAMCQSNLGKQQSAEAAAREAIRLAPSAFQGWQALGIVLARQDRSDEAREALTTALRLRPGDPLTVQTLRKLPSPAR
jgi:tetratricopeptide (TPR) repeat protein